MIHIQASGAPCGARVTGVDLSAPLDAATVDAIRDAWLAHGVIAFPDQHMSIPDLERFTLALGPRGDDPFIAPIPGHAHVVEIRREADEQAPIFAETWHSDWSFLPSPPAGTALHGTVVPPVGGDTLFADQHAAWDALPAAMQGAGLVPGVVTGLGPRGINRRLDLTFGPLPLTAILYMGIARKPAAVEAAK